MKSADGVGPPAQKRGPRRRARAQSHGSPTRRALLSDTPSLAPVQVRREARVRHIDDAAKVLGRTWYARKNRRTWQARTNWQKDDGARTSMTLHQLISEPPPQMEVNHIDGDGLNNRRSNLRFATRSQITQAARVRSDNASGFRSVSWDKNKRKWRALVGPNGRARSLGYFKTKEEAAAAYDAAALRLFGEFARPNGAQPGKATAAEVEP
jgi:AP2 domain/HNH endonuclease